MPRVLMTGVRRTAATILGLAVAMLALSAGPASAEPASRPAPAQSGPVNRAGSWLVDGSGRVVVLHGFNIVRKTRPWLPTRLASQDARFLRHEGFNAARIGLAWSAVEPRPGVYNGRYIRRFVRLERLLGRYGIRALVDFHQDLWSARNMPAWASLGSTYSDNFQHFWDNDPASDGVGIQTHYIRAWKHVARNFRNEPDVIAFDPFNEPQAGYRSGCAPFAQCPAFESGELSTFYSAFVRGIRRVDQEHMILAEPVADNNLTAPALTLPNDPRIGTTFHEYCNLTQTATSSGPQDALCQPIDKQGLDAQTDYARQTLGVPTFVGEFSSNDADDDNATMVDLMGSRFLSWTMWMYYTASSDPANTPGQGLLLDDSMPGSEANAKQPKLDAVAVPYATAIAGTPTRTSYDRTTHTYRLSYATRPVPGARLTTRATTIFLPTRAYPRGANITASHATYHRRAHRLIVRARPGADTVRITVIPASAAASPDRH